MNLPPLTALTLTASGLAVTAAVAMGFLVLWQGPRDRDNRFTCLYFLGIAFWCSSIFAGRFVAVIGGDPTAPFYLTFLGASWSSLALFALASHYTGLWRRPAVRLVLAAEIVLNAFVLPPLFPSERLVTLVSYLPNGLLEYRPTTLGFALFSISKLGCDAMAIGCLWADRRGRGRAFLPGAIIVALPVAIGLFVVEMREYPTAALAAAITCILFARAILLEKLFNPLGAANQRLLEGQLQLAEQNQRLQHEIGERGKLIEELDAFAHTVAHDLKGPLTSVCGYAGLLQEDRATLHGEQREYVEAIARNAETMRRIIEEILLLAGLRRGDAPREVLDMAHLVAQVQSRFGDAITASQAVVCVAEAWPAAIGYPPWVEQVWANYLSNAIKYGGTPPRIELGATPGGNGVHSFWVRDNGPGLSAEERARLFAPFTRLANTQGEGHGLGLSIARRIVERLGGSVAVESTTPRGSVFSFTLPAAG